MQKGQLDFSNIEQFFSDVKSGNLKIVPGDKVQKVVSGQMEIVQKYLKGQHNMSVPDNKLYEIAERVTNTEGKIWIPVVCSADEYLARLEKAPGINYNYAKETLAKAFGFDRRSNGLYLIQVNDSIEPDVDLRISWNVKQEQKLAIDCEHITEYMAHFDFVLHTQQKQLDSGFTWTRTESLYSFDDGVADGYSQGSRFRLSWNNRDNAHTSAGFRAVSDVALVL
jgi:hypothetical protein